MSIHHKAMVHVDRAVELHKRGDYDSLRYAALELRYAIENLVYELVPFYESEIPEEVATAWRPREILDALVDANPYFPSSVVLNMAFQDENGNPGQFATLGKQTGINPKELRGFYGRLNPYLHATADGSRHDETKLKESIEKTIEFLERYRKDTAITHGFDERHEFSCTYCQAVVKRRSSALKESPFVTCPKAGCHALYEGTGEGSSEFRPLEEEFTCPGCGVKSFQNRAFLREGARLHCPACDATVQLQVRLAIVPEAKAGDSQRV